MINKKDNEITTKFTIRQIPVLTDKPAIKGKLAGVVEETDKYDNITYCILGILESSYIYEYKGEKHHHTSFDDTLDHFIIEYDKHEEKYIVTARIKPQYYNKIKAYLPDKKFISDLIHQIPHNKDSTKLERILETIYSI